MTEQPPFAEGRTRISRIGSTGVDDLAPGARLARFANRVTGRG